jgi:hypothetical protein
LAEAIMRQVDIVTSGEVCAFLDGVSDAADGIMFRQRSEGDTFPSEQCVLAPERTCRVIRVIRNKWTAGPEVWLHEKNQRLAAISTRFNKFPRICDSERRLRSPDRNSSKLASSLVGTRVSRIGCDEVWNSETQPNGKEYELLEIGRSHLRNPGVVVGREARLLLKGMNLAFHLRHLVV